MSLCKECDIKPICTIYSDIAKHMVHASINIDRCDFNSHEIGSKGKVEIAKTEVDPFTGKPKVDRNKITELSNKNRQERMKQEKEYTNMRLLICLKNHLTQKIFVEDLVK